MLIFVSFINAHAQLSFLYTLRKENASQCTLKLNIVYILPASALEKTYKKKTYLLDQF